MPNTSSEVSLGKMVKLLAATLHRDKRLLPFKDQKPWHELFYDLKSKPSRGKPGFIDELVFDWDGPYPTCMELSEFLNALHFTANVTAHNPRFEVISVDDDDANRWLQELNGVSTGFKTFLKRAVAIAHERFELRID